MCFSWSRKFGEIGREWGSQGAQWTEPGVLVISQFRQQRDCQVARHHHVLGMRPVHTLKQCRQVCGIFPGQRDRIRKITQTRARLACVSRNVAPAPLDEQLEQVMEPFMPDDPDRSSHCEGWWIGGHWTGHFLSRERGCPDLVQPFGFPESSPLSEYVACDGGPKGMLDLEYLRRTAEEEVWRDWPSRCARVLRLREPWRYMTPQAFRRGSQGPRERRPRTPRSGPRASRDPERSGRAGGGVDRPVWGC